MRKKNPPFSSSATENTRLQVAALPGLVDSWLITGDINRHSERTISNRRERLAKFLWFLQQREYEFCGLAELRAFFQYLNVGLNT